MLMAALQYVDIPNYSAIIFRKTLTDHRQPGGPLSVALSWLIDTDAKFTKDDAGRPAFKFPSGAVLSFGYIGEFGTFERYQGGEYQYIGWDELTQHLREDYTWMFNRLRRTKALKDAGVPLRVRATSNPGGAGHVWVKERFKISRDRADGIFKGHDPARPFMPSFIQDNPFLDQESYLEALQELDPVVRNQMMRGDWDISEEGRFKPDWFPRYAKSGTTYHLIKDNIIYKPQQLKIFCTVDPAASTREGIGEATFYKRQMPSHSVISTWGFTPDCKLLWLDCRRFQKETPDLIQEMKSVYQIWRPSYFGIEQNGPGLPVMQIAARMGLPTKPYVVSHDKVANATDAQNRACQGSIYLPRDPTPWLKFVEEELYNWTGHPHETDDIIDTLSNASRDIAPLAAWHDRRVLHQGNYYSDHVPVVVPHGFRDINFPIPDFQ